MPKQYIYSREDEPLPLWEAVERTLENAYHPEDKLIEVIVAIIKASAPEVQDAVADALYFQEVKD
jgi:hypothetical protein